MTRSDIESFCSNWLLAFVELPKEMYERGEIEDDIITIIVMVGSTGHTGISFVEKKDGWYVKDVKNPTMSGYFMHQNADAYEMGRLYGIVFG